MIQLRIPALILLAVLIFNFAFSQKSAENLSLSYEQSILKERADKDEEMRTGEKSPLPEEAKKDFTGLHYFAPDEKFKVIATLERFDNPFHFKMKTTTERLPEYATFGRISFQFNDTSYQLFVYQNIELMKKPGFEKYLFIPFNDLTNGESSYGGGRFLDAGIPDGDTLTLDFNKAYNPYCAYYSKYSCPIPPKENNLEIRVEAGEKKWHD